MIIIFNPDASLEEEERVREILAEFGLSARSVRTSSGRYVVALGNPKNFDIRQIGVLAGVRDVFIVDDPYQLVSRKWRVHPTIIDIGISQGIGEGNLTLMLGPCSVESEEQLVSVAKFLSSSGVNIIRGGAFKPRSSPYSFQGMGVEGLELLRSVADRFNLKVISEVLEPSQVEMMESFIDIFQVGARNSQNFSLLHELGKSRLPVLLKRGMSGTIEEILQSAEYIFSNGNERILLCERGIRTYETAYRNTLDINAIPVLKEKSHLPVIVDPSHGIGTRRFVEAIGLAAIMAGADGILAEIHPTPERAKSDGQQTLNFLEAEQLINRSLSTFNLKQSFLSLV